MKNLAIILFIMSFYALCPSIADAAERPETIRVIVMPYRLLGDLAGGKIDNEHQRRLEFANKTLRDGIKQLGSYELVDEKSTREFSDKFIAAQSNNACDRCEVAWAKELQAKQIVVPWVFRLSQLVLTMHFVIMDAESGKNLYKKALDFRGDNDESWDRAIQFFLKNAATRTKM